MHLNYAHIAGVGQSQLHPETDVRAYFDGVFTSSAVDTEYRVVHPTNFESIVQQITAGVRVLDSHKHDTNGIGQTVAAMQGEDKVNGTFYILKGEIVDGKLERMRLDSQSYPDTTSWIMAVKDGMANKLSMGWYSERDICNLCGESIWRYPCRHYPGERAPVTDEATGQETMEECTYSCYGITVVEVSMVYFGANPDARLIEKAKALAPQWEPAQIDRIESQLKVAIVDNKRSYFQMPIDKEVQTAIETAVKTAVEKAGTPAKPQEGMLSVTDASGNVVRQIRADELPAAPKPVTESDIQTAVTTAMGPMVEKLADLEKSLASGETSQERQTAIDVNLVEFTRVHGAKGDVEAHKAFLETLPDIATIQVWTAKYKELADAKFGAGRNTSGVLEEVDGEPNPDKDTPEVSGNPM